MIQQIKFFAITQNGDIFSSREFLRQFVSEISKTLPVSLIARQHPNAINLDIPLESPSDYAHLGLHMTSPLYFIDGDTLFINTWVGHFLTAQTHCIANQIPMWVVIANVIREYTGIEIEVSDHTLDYVPVVDTSLLTELVTLDDQHVRVLVCNNPVESGQSNVGDLASTIQRLASKYPEVQFICTNRVPVESSNVEFTDDLCRRSEVICDLSHISVLSEQCDLIVSKMSGPGTFCMTRSNFLDPQKTIVSLCLFRENLFWHNVTETCARTLWTPSNLEEEIYTLLEQEIALKLVDL